jgi:spore germination protein YaaH
VTVAATGRVIAVTVALVTLCVALAGCDDAGDGPDAPPGRLTVAGYLVPWDPRSTPASGAGVLAEVSPVWLRPTDAGTVEFVSELARATAPEDLGVPVAPSISNFRAGRWDGDLVARLVGDPQQRTAHVAAIVDEVRSRGWRGVDLDYESLPAASRDAYSAFVAELADALHQVPARLSVTVHAKTREPGEWSGAQAQDWRAIGAAADEVRVMAYDHSFASSPPGPIAPLPWVDQVLTLAAASVPLERIALGVATYGYDWSGPAPAAAMQWAEVDALAADRQESAQWDDRSASPWLRYADDGGAEHTVWYEDARSLQAKLDLAQRHGVSRVVIWRLGGEDPAIWSTLRAAQ